MSPKQLGARSPASPGCKPRSASSPSAAATNSALECELAIKGHGDESDYLAHQESQECRLVRLRQAPSSSSKLGFSLRGGKEQLTGCSVGVFVSHVEAGGQAQRNGLRLGDQLIQVNGLQVSRATYDDVIEMIRRAARDAEILLLVRFVGRIPHQDKSGDRISWLRVRADGDLAHEQADSAASSRQSLASSSSCCSAPEDEEDFHDHREHFSLELKPTGSASSTSGCSVASMSEAEGAPAKRRLAGDQSSHSASLGGGSSSGGFASDAEEHEHEHESAEERDVVEVRVPGGCSTSEPFGCGVVKGPDEWPGIFVQNVKPGSLASKVGLQPGDQLMRADSFELDQMQFERAIELIKRLQLQQQELVLAVRKGAALRHLASCKQAATAGAREPQVSNQADKEGSRQAIGTEPFEAPGERQQERTNQVDQLETAPSRRGERSLANLIGPLEARAPEAGVRRAIGAEPQPLVPVVAAQRRRVGAEAKHPPPPPPPPPLPPSLPTARRAKEKNNSAGEIQQRSHEDEGNEHVHERPPFERGAPKQLEEPSMQSANLGTLAARQGAAGRRKPAQSSSRQGATVEGAQGAARVEPSGERNERDVRDKQNGALEAEMSQLREANLDELEPALGALNLGRREENARYERQVEEEAEEEEIRIVPQKCKLHQHGSSLHNRLLVKHSSQLNLEKFGDAIEKPFQCTSKRPSTRKEPSSKPKRPQAQQQQDASPRRSDQLPLQQQQTSTAFRSSKVVATSNRSNLISLASSCQLHQQQMALHRRQAQLRLQQLESERQQQRRLQRYVSMDNLAVKQQKQLQQHFAASQFSSFMVRAEQQAYAQPLQTLEDGTRAYRRSSSVLGQPIARGLATPPTGYLASSACCPPTNPQRCPRPSVACSGTPSSFASGQLLQACCSTGLAQCDCQPVLFCRAVSTLATSSSGTKIRRAAKQQRGIAAGSGTLAALARWRTRSEDKLNLMHMGACSYPQAVPQPQPNGQFQSPRVSCGQRSSGAGSVKAALKQRQQAAALLLARQQETASCCNMVLVASECPLASAGPQASAAATAAISKRMYNYATVTGMISHIHQELAPAKSRGTKVAAEQRRRAVPASSTCCPTQRGRGCAECQDCSGAQRRQKLCVRANCGGTNSADDSSGYQSAGNELLQLQTRQAFDPCALAKRAPMPPRRLSTFAPRSAPGPNGGANTKAGSKLPASLSPLSSSASSASTSDLSSDQAPSSMATSGCSSPGSPPARRCPAAADKQRRQTQQVPKKQPAQAARKPIPRPPPLPILDDSGELSPAQSGPRPAEAGGAELAPSNRLCFVDELKMLAERTATIQTRKKQAEQRPAPPTRSQCGAGPDTDSATLIKVINASKSAAQQSRAKEAAKFGCCQQRDGHPEQQFAGANGQLQKRCNSKQTSGELPKSVKLRDEEDNKRRQHELGVMPEITRALERMDWLLPTEIQAEAIPLILGGGDVLMASETGTGKTGAFCVPIVQVVYEQLLETKNVPKQDSQRRKQTSDVNDQITLSVSDRDPDLVLSNDLLIAQSKSGQWQGCRSSKGIRRLISGKQKPQRVYYEVYFADQGLARVGWSFSNASLELGTDRDGWGYGGTAKKSNDRQFQDYGQTFGEKFDIVGCILDLGTGEVTFTKNGRKCGVAYRLPLGRLEKQEIYPTICVKNAGCQVRFSPVKSGDDYKPDDCEWISALSDQLVQNKQSSGTQDSRGPLAVIMEPSRELAKQTHDCIRLFSKDLHIESILMVGGGSGDSNKSPNDKTHIVVCTPGRLQEAISRDQLPLGNVHFFILDEADGLLLQGFESLIRSVASKLPRMFASGRRMQTVCCSATLHNFQVKKLAQDLMYFPTWIDLKGEDSVPDTVHHVVLRIDPKHDKTYVQLEGLFQTDNVHENDRVEDNLFNGRDLSRSEELSQAVKLLKFYYTVKAIESLKMDQGIIFCRTKLDCDNLSDFMLEMNRKSHSDRYSCTKLHSSLSQQERTGNLEDFKRGKVKFLICTDVAARGIDIKGVPYVIQVTLPDEKANYLHRIGRVGRAERMGLAVSLVANVPEKVWYHSCRRRECSNTRLVEKGGCCKWFDELGMLAEIEEHLKCSIQEIQSDFKIQVDEYDGKVSYGAKRLEQMSTYEGHVEQLKAIVSNLTELESKAQSNYLNFYLRTL